MADVVLTAAGAAMRAALLDLKASGPFASTDEDRQAWARFDAAHATISTVRATTVAGAVVKLQRAILLNVPDGWVENAIAANDAATLVMRSGELSEPARLLVEALLALEAAGGGE